MSLSSLKSLISPMTHTSANLKQLYALYIIIEYLPNVISRGQNRCTKQHVCILKLLDIKIEEENKINKKHEKKTNKGS